MSAKDVNRMNFPPQTLMLGGGGGVGENNKYFASNGFYSVSTEKLMHALLFFAYD